MPGNDFSTIFETTGNVVAAPVLNQAGGNPILSGLASGLGEISDQLNSDRTRRRQAESDARESLRFQNEQQDRARVQQERDARSAAFRAIYGVNRALSAPNTPAPSTGQPIGNSPMSLASIAETSAFHQDAGAMATALIDGAVEAGQTDPNTVRRIRDAAASAAPVIQSQEVAVSQGRMPSLAVAATVDRVFGELINQFPGHEQVIAAAFKEMGVDNALFDELRTEVDRVSADRTQEQETRDAAYDRGVQEIGEDALNRPRDDVVRAGMEAMRQDSELEALAKRVSVQVQQQSLLTGEAALRDREEGDAAEEAVRSASSIGVAMLAPQLEEYNRLVAMIGQPGAYPDLEARLANMETLIVQHKGTIVGNLIAAIAPNAGLEEAERLSGFLNNYFDQTFIRPMTTRNAENARVIQTLTTRAGLTMRVAMPFVSALRSMGISPTALQPLIDSLSEGPLLTRFQQEMEGLTELDFTQPAARQQLVEIVEILKGNASIQSFNYDSRTAAQAFRVVNNVGRSLATTINRTGDTSSGNEFLSAVGEVVVASRQLNRNTPAQSLINAGRSLLGPNFGGADMIGAITRLKNDPTQADRANIIGRGYRAAAAQTLLNFRQSPHGESGRFQIVWRSGRVAGQDYGDGRFQIVDTTGEPRNLPSYRGDGERSALPVLRDSSSARPDRALQDTVRTMNGLLDVLVQTNDWGDGARGTPREIRRFYARGELPPGMVRERQATASRETEIRRSMDRLEANLLNPEAFTLQTDNTATPTGGEAAGNPSQVTSVGGQAWQQVKASIGHYESGNGRTYANTTGSTATGLYQFTRGTWLSNYRQEFPNDRRSDSQILELRRDRNIQERIMDRVGRSYMTSLQEMGQPATPANLYMFHHFGRPGTVRRILEAGADTPLTSVFTAAEGPSRARTIMDQNPHLRGKTAGWLRNEMARRTRRR